MTQDVRELTARVREQAEPRLERVATTVTTTAAPLVVRAAETATPLAARAAESAGPVVVTLSDALGTSRVRGAAAWDALRGGPVGPPIAVRRWPWAVGAAVLGAAAGAVVALLVGRLQGQDAPGAQDPEDLEAVVDRPVDPVASSSAFP